MIKVIFEVIEAVFKALGVVLSELWKLFFVKDHTPNSSFGKRRDVLSKKGGGYVLDGKKSQSIEISERHVMVSAITGKGKSSCILTPSCLLIDDFSMIVYAPDKQSARITKAAKIKQGYDVGTFDVVTPTGLFYNMFERCSTHAEIGKTVTKFVESTQGGGKEDKFFLTSSIEAISIVVIGLKAHPQYCNGYNVLYIIDCLQDEERRPQIIRYFEEFTDERTVTRLKALLNTSPNTLGSILSSAKASLNIFNDETVAYITSKDNIDLTLLRNSKYCLYLHSSITDMEYYSSVFGAFMHDLSSFLFEDIPSDDDNKVMILIDEAPSVRFDLDVMVSQGRKFGVSCLIVGQNLDSQLSTLYGEEKKRTIITGTYTRVFMGADDLRVARELSESFGTYTYVDSKDSNKKKTRPLMTPTEIMQMEDNTALIVTSGKKPVKVKQTPFYKNRKLKKLTELPYEDEETLEVQKVPLIHLNDLVPEEDFAGELVDEDELDEEHITDEEFDFI